MIRGRTRNLFDLPDRLMPVALALPIVAAMLLPKLVGACDRGLIMVLIPYFHGAGCSMGARVGLYLLNPLGALDRRFHGGWNDLDRWQEAWCVRGLGHVRSFQRRRSGIKDRAAET